jgi:plastocyanin
MTIARLRIAALIPLAFIAAAPSAARPAQAAAAVAIRNFAFTPQILTVHPGTTVTWTNTDEEPHTVTSTTKAFGSGALDTGGTYRFTFTKAGEYAYYCALHPHMTGKIIVK